MDKKRYDEKLLQDSFWRERIFGFRELSEEKITRRMSVLNLSLRGPHYCVVLFAPYLMEKDAEKIDSIMMNLLYSVREGYRSAGIDCYTISDTYCNVVGILSVESEEAYRRLSKLTHRMTHELIRDYDVNMFVGIGEKVSLISELNKSKDTASEALAHKFSFSQDHVISARDVKRYYNQSDVELKMHYNWILGCFYDGNMELLEIRMRNLFADVTQHSPDPLDSIRNICIELTATLLRVVREMGVSRSPEMDGIYTFIAQMERISDIAEWFLQYCSGMLQKVGELRQDKTQQIMNLAENYIAENIGSPDLSIQSISDYVDLSAPYFSNIFFRAKGMHINEYINRMRVRQAQKMLTETNDKAVSIAQSLGFSSPNYFNSVFKKYTGITPKRFRETARGNDNEKTKEKL